MSRLRTLTRLTTLYAQLERNRLSELRVANLELQKTEQMLHELRAGRRQEAERGSQSLRDEDVLSWRLAEHDAEHLGVRTASALAHRTEQAQGCATVEAAHRASRVELEQMKLLQKREREEQALRAARTAQAISDDRFAARGSWLGRYAGGATAGTDIEDEAPLI